MKQIAPLVASLDEVSPDRLAIIAEVIRDSCPSERWLKVPEISAVKVLRRLRPEGLTQFDQEAVHTALSRNIDPTGTP